MKKLLALTAAAMLCACNSEPTTDADPFEGADPLRPFNEAVFEFNLTIDQYLIRPAARGYHMLPGDVRYGVGNFLSNLGEPITGVNNLLQADFQGFGTTLFRFILNTTFGFGGLRDFASENGLPERDQTFNHTLRHYGVGTGPYLVLPILGPSSARGVAGRVGDYFADPFSYYLEPIESAARNGVEGVVARDRYRDVIDQLYYKSLDPYVATRSTYLQHGGRSVTNGVLTAPKGE